MASRSEAAQVEEAILRLCSHNPDGVSNTSIVNDDTGELAHIPKEARLACLNSMLKAGKVSLFHMGKNLVIRMAAPVDAKIKGLNTEEMLVYQVIKQAGNTGVWTRDMKVRTNFGQPQITKILKVLEAKSLIKSVKNVNNPSRKLYMLHELEPSREITGGAWYTDQQLDREYIDVLREACFRMVAQTAPHPTLADIAARINGSGLSRVELLKEDVDTVLETLVCDGRIEAIEDEEGQERFRPAVLKVPATTAFTSIPCGVCPVMDQCTPGGQVSPQTCVYYQAWLDF